MAGLYFIKQTMKISFLQNTFLNKPSKLCCLNNLVFCLSWSIQSTCQDETFPEVLLWQMSQSRWWCCIAVKMQHSWGDFFARNSWRCCIFYQDGAFPGRVLWQPFSTLPTQGALVSRSLSNEYSMQLLSFIEGSPGQWFQCRLSVNTVRNYINGHPMFCGSPRTYTVVGLKMIRDKNLSLSSLTRYWYSYWHFTPNI